MGYTSIDQVDRAISRQLRFYRLLSPEGTELGSDTVLDALLDARLRLTKRAEQIAQANAALRRIAAQTRVP